MGKHLPATRFTRGTCTVSIFFDEVQKEGETVSIPKAVFPKRYRDKAGIWRTTPNLDTSDIPKAVLCLNDAFDYLTREIRADSDD